MLLLIDNYDSFTYNLVQRLGTVAPQLEVQVFRNDEIDVARAAELGPTHVLISPGPCTPLEGGVSNDIIRHFTGKVPLLGVCLGHQCIGHTTGATIVRAQRLMHGKTSMIRHDGKGIFAGLSNPFQATRYHSLVIQPDTLAAEFEISATCEDDETEIMAIRHKEYDLDGVQFHPESFLTTEGDRLLANFVNGV